MPRRVDVTLSEEERELLECWARREKSAQAPALRCRIVLAAGRRRRSAAGGVASHAVVSTAHYEPRPGQPRKITDEDVERVSVKTLEEKPTRSSLTR